MGENSKIEWTDHTFNPWIGCTKVGPPCDNCYAEALMDHRYHRVEWGPHGERSRTSQANWRKPRQWAKAAKATGERPRVFCASLADWLDNAVPQNWRDDLGDLIRATPELDWLLLTKRIGNYADLAPWEGNMIPPNVWLGITCGSQDEYNRDWPRLAEIAATVHFISYEPALAPLRPLISSTGWRPEWVICGGENVPSDRKKERRLDPQWARELRDDCAKSGVAFFMKQMTGKAPIPDDLLVREFPNL